MTSTETGNPGRHPGDGGLSDQLRHVIRMETETRRSWTCGGPNPEVTPDPEGTVAGTSPVAGASLLEEILVLSLFPGSADAKTPPHPCGRPRGGHSREQSQGVR